MGGDVIKNRRSLPKFISYAITIVLGAIVVGATFKLLFRGSAFVPLLALVGGAVAWGSAARVLRTPVLALPAIALVVEFAVAFEFKRLYVLHDVDGPPTRSFRVFRESLFISDLAIAGLLAGFGCLGWLWARRRASVNT